MSARTQKVSALQADRVSGESRAGQRSARGTRRAVVPQAGRGVALNQGRDQDHPSDVVLDHQEVTLRLGATVTGPLPAAPFRGVCHDDRRLEGDLFVAVRGDRHDPYPLLPTLPARGVRGIVGEQAPPAGLEATYYRVDCARRALALLEQAGQGDPAQAVRLFGITGTNGKSTSVRLLAGILAAADRSAGWVSTVTTGLLQPGADPQETPSRMTTPEPSILARTLRDQVDAGADDVVLEVSSHALAQERVAGLEFAGALLTNLSRDHFDYHGSREAYLEAKLRLFAQLENGAPMVLPKDGPVPPGDPRLEGQNVRFFADEGPADAFVEEAQHERGGTRARLRVLGESLNITTPMIGRHNLRNVLGVVLLARAAGIASEAIEDGLRSTPPVKGRLESVGSDDPSLSGPDAPRVFVDYAHTPDALRAVLEAVREITVGAAGRSVVLFGCGGDRDRGKRPEMGRIAEDWADLVFVTSDNPRSEDPARIVSDVLEGMREPARVQVEVDRKRAIGAALSQLRPRDVLVVAGKGHEAVQEVGGERFPFDDRKVIEELLASRTAPAGS